MSSPKRSKVHNDLSPPVEFASVCILPVPSDNAAVARDTLPQGTCIRMPDGRTLTLSHTVLEGHRFSLVSLPPGGAIMSWNLPFGYAITAIEEGDYLVNELMLYALKGRRDVTFELPKNPNFTDPDTSAKKLYEFDEKAFVAGLPNPIVDPAATFQGYYRGPRRGGGTRNHVAVIALTSLSAPFVRSLETRYRSRWTSFDGVRIVAHTEGEAPTQLNLPLVLRTLAGFACHCNLACAVIVSAGAEQHVTKEVLQTYMAENAYPTSECDIRWVDLTGDRLADIPTLDAVVDACATIAAAVKRTPVLLSSLRIALQCGGSDAFSGLAGNPLAGDLAARLMAQGASALLAESPELVGAEHYILENTASLEVAKSFLATTEAYKSYAMRHGQDAAGNPSGGNLYRGLYNIVIKSLGAARKKPANTTLQGVLKYGEPMVGSGQYLFMDSPGNDLESIAGQVASGCNLVIFITGNGSMTNFPFVPTLKVVTTTRRFALLENEMDINAGVLNDNVPMSVAGADAANLALRVANGQITKGEIAGHSQVSIWRNWFRAEGDGSAAAPAALLYTTEALAGAPIAIRQEPTEFGDPHTPIPHSSARHIGIVLPTSICSSEISKTITEAYNAEGYKGLRWVSPQHTEGCGAAGGPLWESLYNRLMVGHVSHPYIREGLFLEHGCEKTHNDYFRAVLAKNGVQEASFGFAGIQSGGGLEKARVAVRAYFDSLPPPAALGTSTPPPLSLGLAVHARVVLPLEGLLCLGSLVRWLVHGGASVVIPSDSQLLTASRFLSDVALEGADTGTFRPTLAYAQRAVTPGFHIMEVHDGMDWVEGISGVSVSSTCILIIGRRTVHGSVLVPSVNVDVAAAKTSGDWAAWYGQLVSAVRAVAAGGTDPLFFGNANFSVPRGTTGVSL